MADNATGVDGYRCPTYPLVRLCPVGSALIGADRDEFIRGPKWRTRTSTARRARAATSTFALIVATGGVILVAVMWGLRWLGAPRWMVIAPWAVPMVAVLIWTLLRPRPAIATDDDDDGWTTYSIQFALVGEESPRPVAVRMIAAALFGAPVIWSLFVFGLSALIGLY